METKPPENLIIPTSLAQDVVNYILMQPCPAVPMGEAYKLLKALEQLQPLPQPAAPTNVG